MTGAIRQLWRLTSAALPALVSLHAPALTPSHFHDCLSADRDRPRTLHPRLRLAEKR
ncbi:MAG: hypothetical protein OJF62_000469 [Pseudolabrys sp.]|nr:hypothetical protein [Pseudolabrys sp.]